MRATTNHLGLIGCTIATLFGATSLWNAAVSSAATTAVPAAVSQVASAAFPGATVSLGSGIYGQSSDALGSLAPATGGAATTQSAAPTPLSDLHTLEIQLADPTPDGTALDNTFDWADTGWKAQLVAAVSAVANPSITGYSLSEPDGTVPSEASNFFQGSVRSDPTNSAIDDADMDTITHAQAESQLNSNIATLSSALGAGGLESSSVTVIPLGAGTNSFALAATLDVSSVADLDGHIGDIVDGLETGLLGGSKSLIEGLGIQVFVDNTPEIGAWEAARAGSGDLQFNKDLTVPDVLTPTQQFANLTAGPAASASALGATSSVLKRDCLEWCRHTSSRRYCNGANASYQ